MGTVALVVMMAMMVAIAGYLIVALMYSVRQEKKQANLRRTWANFSLSIAFATLFLATWALQGVAQWQQYVDKQRDHNAEIKVVDYLQDFSQSTLENWQSEFLQLFSFVVLSALFIHHGSAESKDSDDRMEQALNRIEQKLGTKG